VSSTGRLSGAEETLLDFNRSGIPLIEIVTDPVSNPRRSSPFCGRTASHLEVSGHKQRQMELGQLRCDVNVSVELDGKEGTRVEIKNLNSIRAIRQALSYEYNRHVGAYKRGETIHKKPGFRRKDKSNSSHAYQTNLRRLQVFP